MALPYELPLGLSYLPELKKRQKKRSQSSVYKFSISKFYDDQAKKHRLKKPSYEYIGQNLYIRPNYVVSLPEYYSEHKKYSVARKKNEENLKDNQHGGVLSQKADRKLKNAVNWLVCQAKQKIVCIRKTDFKFKFRINFITLTLPDTDEKIDEKMFQENLLNPFLTLMRSQYHLKNYVWKLEFQKNGKLHVHFTTDTFIHHNLIRSKWNNIMRKHGYLQAFAKKFGHTDPNSTDVHSVRKIRNIAGYIAKYMSKDMSSDGLFKGRIWGCNFDLSQANKTRLFVPRTELSVDLRGLFRKEIECKPITTGDVAMSNLKKIGDLFFLKYSDWENYLSGNLLNAFSETLCRLQVAGSEWSHPDVIWYV